MSAGKAKASATDWRAESDAMVIADYQAIVADKARMAKAVKAAKSRAADLDKQASALRNVASSSSGGRAASKSSRGGRKPGGRR